MSYYTLVTRHDDDGKFYPQFGDYDRETVEQECKDSWPDVSRHNWRIVRTKDEDQGCIDEAISKLNAKERHLRFVRSYGTVTVGEDF